VRPVRRRRIDSLLAERGLAPSRTSAAESVRAGLVRIGRDGPLAAKPSELVEDDAELVVSEERRFVSRGGIKLENALEALAIDVAGLDCLDVGASTGGFTDCLLRRGAARVIALDVAHGQLDWSLRNDPRVIVVERANARGLTAEELPYRPALATVDVSFISLVKVVPAVAGCLGPGGRLLAMVKPQFELGRGRVKAGVVRDAAERREALRSVAAAIEASGLGVRGFASSGLPGPKGNLETFVHAVAGAEPHPDLDAAIAEVEP
jgi:23S rRNA (cytidine1920-2'-O)/16S rRNA (cytidine1409-2'-O)-methyltransferase